MGHKRSLYLSAPIAGLTPKECFAVFDSMAIDLGDWYTILSPMSGKDILRRSDEVLGATDYTEPSPILAHQAIFERDRWMVHQCDLMLVNLKGAKKVSIGCMFELAWGYQAGKHIVLIMEPGNVHWHLFPMEAAHVRFEDYDDARHYLQELAG